MSMGVDDARQGSIPNQRIVNAALLTCQVREWRSRHRQMPSQTVSDHFPASGKDNDDKPGEVVNGKFWGVQVSPRQENRPRRTIFCVTKPCAKLPLGKAIECSICAANTLKTIAISYLSRSI
ncbi:hypothetical protein EN805_19495 [bacterium M00.F.Ca.ET.162.01.1.1]|nr:hypothetical protein EN848_04515 [bacterium M00.F.Ca.ET.205.01.1.1]TGU53360.1 hypothetical protein EN795_08930 [bacterium M00.F.Ca.ET.152.01.1.1]TGZ41711.1 hypothetical protein EN805_19495 [bacterium M00.F.Ca.ET.162.01.1.1]